MRLFLGGDVMTGRGIDQILSHPGHAALYEPLVRDARVYVELAEQRNGAIDRPVDDGYIWGEAMEVLERWQPDARIVNLETSVTTHDEPWVGKAIHYRMHPANVGCLSRAGINCCTLANNHVMDWGRAGLLETLETLEAAGIATAGAGRDAKQAAAPWRWRTASGQTVALWAMGCIDSGILWAWAARPTQTGVNLLEPVSEAAADRLADVIETDRAATDVAVVSIHWGGNWGYRIEPEQRAFARRLIERGVDVVHGHSSHHVKAMEMYRGRPIFYGCGDLLDDYEGIGGFEAYRPELAVMLFVEIAGRGEPAMVRAAAMRIEKFQLRRASAEQRTWLAAVLNRQSAAFGTQVREQAEGHWVVEAA